jgi:SAM-dependent methyltransferase
MLARAYERIGARVAVADAHDLPVASQSVDAVVTVWVLHVVGDPARTVREIARVLRPGGRWIVMSADALPSDDDIAPIVLDLDVAIGRYCDAPERVREWAAAVGLPLFADTATEPVVYELSPNDTVSAIETRTGSSYWDLTDEQWDRLVVPHLDRLRALPDPDRKRERALSSPLLVFERPA